jgi:tetratricopeptide (TPR) repeat protein
VIGGAQTFARLARQLEAERREAAAIVSAIVADIERHLDTPLNPAWRTFGMVQLLCDAAREELVRSPKRSLHVAQLAAAIADALPDTYPAVLHAQGAAEAWKSVSNAHRFQSRYEAALQALDIADRRVAGIVVLAYDRAVLALARAITLREIGRTTEALLLLDGAREVFNDHRDLKQLAQCDLATGLIQQRAGNFAAARQAFMRVIPSARDAGDLHTMAAAYNNLGRAAAEHGDIHAAVDALAQARAIFRELDMPTEIARVTWTIGMAQLAAGRYEPAIAILRDARAELLRLAMPEEAGLAGVDLIEALLAMNARAEARELAAIVAGEFRTAGLNERALQAVAYLQESADVASPATAHRVGVYLRRLKEEPALIFIAPDPEQ